MHRSRMKPPSVPTGLKASPLRNEEYDLQPQLLERLRRSRIFTLALFTIVVVLLYADQNLMAPNLSAIAEDFGFSDEEKDRRLGGDIAVAFFGFGAPASLVIGWLTDVVDRRKLFVAIVLVGEIGALATVWVTTYSQLYWTRALTGVAIGGGIPLVFSILGDLVGASRRTEASGLIGISLGLGQGMGQVIAGFTGRATSLGWRFPFLLVSAPCVVLSAVLYVATRDPPRGRSEQGLQDHFQAGGEYTERPNLKGLRLLVFCPTVIMVLAQGLPGCIPWGVIGVYLNDFLHKQRGLTIEQATTVVVLFGVSASVGQLAGAKIGQLAYNRHAVLQSLLMGATTIGGVVPCVMLVRYDGGIVWIYALYAIMGGILAAVTGPNVRSVLMNVTLPSTRGTAFGVFNLFDDLGKGLGPALVSLIVAKSGREKAFTNAMLAWLACGAILLSTAFTVRRDEAKVQAHLTEYAKAHAVNTGSRFPLSLPMRALSGGAQYYAVSDDDVPGGTERDSVAFTFDEERA
ncbi:unnamed protein product [Ascophyllum nodosum]